MTLTSTITPHLSGLLGYVGPGAGFAVAASFFGVFITILIAIPSLLVLPFRWLYRWIRFRDTRQRRLTSRVVVLGLDGLDPNVMDEMIAQGELPNFAAMPWRTRLATVPPPLSPVAWSSFATGCYPGSHRIFDFIHCNPRNYQPYLSSVDVQPSSRMLRLGKVQIPLGRARVKALWKGEHFWDRLGAHGVFSTVLRVPITFPATIRRGHLLSGMCVPDLLGSQGVSTLFTDAPLTAADEEAGRVVRVRLASGTGELPLSGPADPFRPDGPQLTAKLEFTAGRNGDGASLRLAGRSVPLPIGHHTDWVPIAFRSSLGAVNGMCRFRLAQIRPQFKLYATAIHIDPASPAMPVSAPSTFGVYLAKLFGRFGTLGIVEDTTAYETGAIDGSGMLAQCFLAHDEREKQFFHALKTTRRGLVVCVFDTPDRVQHMFWREHDAGDPTIREMYRRMDDLVGRTRKALGGDTVLFVMSDHGFNAFRRQVHINSWLRENGYVVRRESTNGKSNGDHDPLWMRGFDMSKTIAFGFGLAGIHLNRKSFFAGGILSDAQAQQVKARLIRDLEALTDPVTGERPIAKAQDAAEVYKDSPYGDAAPDIIIGWRPGYRVSWESAKGQCLGPVFSDNERHWSGDHCFFPPMVPGVLMSTIALSSREPRIVDVAPTIMQLLGVNAPAHLDGRSLCRPPGGGGQVAETNDEATSPLEGVPANVG